MSETTRLVQPVENSSSISPPGEMIPQRLRTFVIDTSVLLSDPRALERFAGHSVVLPVTVLAELEAKRHDIELGYFARRALRNLDRLRRRHGRLDEPVATGEEGGLLRVDLAGEDLATLPSGMR